MKKILFMLPILAVALVSCNKDNGDELSGDDIIQFKDPNFLSALLNVGAEDPETGDVIEIDPNKDGNISINEASKVQGLAFYGLDDDFYITNMSEMKYFTALLYLDCEGYQVSTLDISGCSVLEELYLSSNKLTQLDLSHNSALRTIYCGHNQIVSLDISNNNNLIQFTSVRRKILRQCFNY